MQNPTIFICFVQRITPPWRPGKYRRIGRRRGTWPVHTSGPRYGARDRLARASPLRRGFGRRPLALLRAGSVLGPVAQPPVPGDASSQPVLLLPGSPGGRGGRAEGEFRPLRGSGLRIRGRRGNPRRAARGREPLRRPQVVLHAEGPVQAQGPVLGPRDRPRVQRRGHRPARVAAIADLGVPPEVLPAPEGHAGGANFGPGPSSPRVQAASGVASRRRGSRARAARRSRGHWTLGRLLRGEAAVTQGAR